MHVFVFHNILFLLLMPGPSEEEERLKAEVKKLKDELEKSKRGTLTSQRGQDGELMLLP